MNFFLHQKVGAEFQLVAHKGDGIPTRQTARFKNLVLDSGLDRMSVDKWIDRCCVGSGNSVPVKTQVGLDAFIASTQTQQSISKKIQITDEPYYYAITVTWRFSQGMAAGNISEVGLGWADDKLWNRALIKDINGNPTTITVLADEYLDVISEIRVYPVRRFSGSFNLLDKTGKTISEHTYKGLPVLINTYAYFDKIVIGAQRGIDMFEGDIGESLTSTPSGSSNYFQGSVKITYPTPRSVRLITTLGLETANFLHKSFLIRIGGLLSSASNVDAAYKVQISPTITKTSSQVMTYTFEMSWDRYE